MLQPLHLSARLFRLQQFAEAVGADTEVPPFVARRRIVRPRRNHCKLLLSEFRNQPDLPTDAIPVACSANGIQCHPVVPTHRLVFKDDRRIAIVIQNYLHLAVVVQIIEGCAARGVLLMQGRARLN